MNPQRHIYDVVIAGGGMVGLAIAAAIRSQPALHNLRIAIIDKQPQPPPVPKLTLPQYPELRVSTLTPASVSLLKQVGAWHLIAPPRSASFHDMCVYDTAGRGFVRYDSHTIGQGDMGWVAENSVITSALYDTISPSKDSGGGGDSGDNSVEYIANTSVAGLDLPPYGVLGAGPVASIHLENGRSLQARLVVAADGANSKIRSMAGLRLATHKDYRQRGLVATVTTDPPNNKTAIQRFLPTGPLALLPVRDGYSNIVWTLPPGQAVDLEESFGPTTVDGNDDEVFVSVVNEALKGGPNYPPRHIGGGRLGSVFVEPPTVTSVVGASPRSFPLILKHAGKYVRPRLTLVGDAAHAVHPLAGQGVNLGFSDVAALIHTVKYAVETGQDIGDITLLESMYERPRKKANGIMIGALDGLQKVFGAESGVVGAVRSMGLGLVDATPLVKQTILRYAMFG